MKNSDNTTGKRLRDLTITLDKVVMSKIKKRSSKLGNSLNEVWITFGVPAELRSETI